MADKYMELLESIRVIAGKPVEEDKKELIYLKALAGFIVKACEMEEKVKGDYFTSNTFEVLLEENNNLYKEIMGENYNRSYGNPAYAVSVFGEELGRVFTYLYNRFCSMIKLAFNHEVERIEKLNSLYMDIYNSIESNGAKTENLLRLVKNFEKDMLEVEAKARIEDVAVKIEGYVSEIIQKEDLRDIRYLFKYGRYIGENEIKTAEFLANYGKIEEISKTVVNAYINGFTRDNKDYRKKSTVRVIFNVGQESIQRCF